MKISFNSKLKIFIITALVILVAGMTMVGILNFNYSIDESASYEMQISVDDKIANDVLKSSAESLFGEASQELDGGKRLIYKFDYDATGKISDVKTAVENALSDSELSSVKVTVGVYQKVGYYDSQALNIALALGIASLVIFAYALIINKLACGVAVLCSSVLSMLLFFALMAITRIPATYWPTFMGVSAAFGAGLSFAITSKYKAETKVNDKSSGIEIGETVHNSAKLVYMILAGIMLVAGIVAGAISLMSSLYLGLTILVAGVASISSSVFMTPCIYALIKDKKI